MRRRRKKRRRVLVWLEWQSPSSPKGRKFAIETICRFLYGKNYDTKHYSLQAVIATGFKVNSARAVQFRKWVNQIAKDYTIQGWVNG